MADIKDANNNKPQAEVQSEALICRTAGFLCL